MKVAIVYESLTGNTRRAAEVMGAELERRGVESSVSSITDIDLQFLATADLVVIGGWVDGLFFFGQRPGRAGRFETFPAIDGKRCFLYVTYAIDPGKTLTKLTKLVEGRGGEVLGGLAIKRNRIDEGARAFVDELLANVGV